MRTTRKLLALVLAVAMVFTMTAMTALATGGDDGTTTPDSAPTTPSGGTTTPDGGATAPGGGPATPGGGTTPAGGTTTPGGGPATPDDPTTPGDPATPEVFADAQAVIVLIEALPTSEEIQEAMTADTFDVEAYKAQVSEARAAYDALLEEQKAGVTNYKTLTQAEANLASLELIKPLGNGDVCQIEGGGQFASLKDSEDDAFQVITPEGKITEYKTVKEARSAMQNGYTLKLLKDYVSTEDYNYGISIDKRNITIDLNGYSVTSNNTQASNGYAIKLEQKYGGACDNTVTIKNSGSKQSVLSSSNYQVTTQSGDSRYNQVVKFEGDIVFQNINGEEPLGIKLGTGAKLLDTESARALIPNGGFSVKEADGNSYIYGNLANAAGRSADGNIVLLNDYVGSDKIVSGQKSGALDLDGHTYTYTGGDAAIDVNYPGVTLTVKNGSVVVTDESADGAVLVGAPDTDNMNSRGLVLDNVQLTVPGNAYGIVTNGTETDNTVTLKNNSVLNVENGYGIYFPSDGKVIIDNSTINAKHVGVQLCAGDLTVTGESAITVTGQPQEKTEGDGPVADGAAVSIINRDGYQKLGTVKIESGDFNAVAGVTAVKAYSFNNTDKKEDEWAEAGKVVGVTGGKFSSDVKKYITNQYDQLVTEKETTPFWVGRYTDIGAANTMGQTVYRVTYNFDGKSVDVYYMTEAEANKAIEEAGENVVTKEPVAAKPTPSGGGSGSGSLPVILSPVWNQTVSVVEHGTLTMSVLARGASSYQWYVDRGDGRFVAIAGATGDSLTIWPDMGDHGNRYYCRAMNGYGGVNSPYFTLCVVRSALPPKTGDQVCVTLWVCLMALGVAGVLAALNRQKNR